MSVYGTTVPHINVHTLLSEFYDPVRLYRGGTSTCDYKQDISRRLSKVPAAVSTMIRNNGNTNMTKKAGGSMLL